MSNQGRDNHGRDNHGRDDHGRKSKNKTVGFKNKNEYFDDDNDEQSSTENRKNKHKNDEDTEISLESLNSSDHVEPIHAKKCENNDSDSLDSLDI
jgi:hypothetical protein